MSGDEATASSPVALNGCDGLTLLVEDPASGEKSLVRESPAEIEPVTC